LNFNDLFLSFPEINFDNKVKHGDRLLFLGSCFSDEIAKKSRYSGLNVLTNPLGTIFHPIVLSRFLNDLLSENETNERVSFRDDRYFSWDAGMAFGNSSLEKLNIELSEQRNQWNLALLEAKFLFLTFGSAWGYYHKEKELLVANCLKFEAKVFDKRLISSDSIVEEWNNVIRKIRAVNPNIQICFTVSPVRHIRDGLVENMRSKAILLEAVHQIIMRNKLTYIPVFEVFMDVLRDYRFYKSDLVHPSDKAVELIWQWLKDSLLDSETKLIADKVMAIRKSEAHQLINDRDYLSWERHIQDTKLTKEKLSMSYPQIVW